MQRVQWLLFAGAVAVATAPVGCSLLVDTSGLTSSSAAPSGDAAGDGPSSLDAAGDAPASDGRATDAGALCDATFCDDFDDGPVGAKWSRSIVNKGALDLSMKFTSPPSSLRARFFGTDAPDDRYAMLERDLGMGTHVRCDFSMYVSVRVDKDFNDAFRIRTTAAGVSSYLLYMVLPATGGIALADDIQHADGSCECPQKLASFASLPVGAWKRITIETDFTSATLSIDDVFAVHDTFGPIVPDGPIVVGLGGRAFSSITSDTLFDDFSCTIAK